MSYFDFKDYFTRDVVCAFCLVLIPKIDRYLNVRLYAAGYFHKIRHKVMETSHLKG